MAEPKRLSTEESEILLPIITTGMASAKSALEERMEPSIQFTRTESFLTGLEDDDLGSPNHAHFILDVSGDVKGRVVCVMPVRLALTLTALMAKVGEEEVEQNRAAAELRSDDRQLLEEIGDVLGRGLNRAFGDASLHAIEFKLDRVGSSAEQPASEEFDEASLVHFKTEGKIGDYPGEAIHLFMTRQFVAELTGLDISGGAQSGSGSLMPMSFEGSEFALIGCGLDRSEQQIIRKLAERCSLKTNLTYDVQDLMLGIVNNECAAIVIGDQSTSAKSKLVDTHVAIMKRVRSHPKGKELPVMYLMRFPDREDVVRMARLGVLRILGVPVDPGLFEGQVHQFLGDALAPQSGIGDSTTPVDQAA